MKPQRPKAAGTRDAVIISRLSQLRSGATAYVSSLRGMGNQHNLAAGSVANLGTKWNDVLVMMAAGQNPIQLAMQQSTQITQIIGPLGAAGTVRALGTALVSVLNPVSLITIGSIAAGAAMFQWLTGASEEAKTLEDQIDELTGKVTDYVKAANAADVGTEELRVKFGEAADEVESLLRKIAEAKQRELEFTISGTINTIVDESGFGTGDGQFGSYDALRMREFFETQDSGTLGRAHKKVLAELFRDYGLLGEAADASVATQIAALENLINSFEAAAAASGSVSREENARIQGLQDTLLQWQEMNAVTVNGTETATKAEEERISNFSKGMANVIADAKEYLSVRVQEASAEQSFLTDLREEAAIKAAINKHGQDSAQVAQLRAAASQRAVEQRLRELSATGQLSDEARAVLNTLMDVSRVDIASGVSAAADEAQRMAAQLLDALSATRQLAQQGDVSLRESQIRLEFAEDPVGQAGALARERFLIKQAPRREGAEGGELAALDAEVEAYVRVNQQIARNNQLRTTATGGGKATDQQRQALQRLVEQQELQLAVLRETDPVRRELLRYASAMAGASDAERASVEKLIAARVREEEAVSQVQDRQEVLQNVGNDAFEGLIFRGEKLSDVLKNIGADLAYAVYQASFLGTGPLAGLFGGNGGGLIGTAVDAIFGTGAAGAGAAAAGSGVALAASAAPGIALPALGKTPSLASASFPAVGAVQATPDALPAEPDSPASEAPSPIISNVVSLAAEDIAALRAAPQTPDTPFAAASPQAAPLSAPQSLQAIANAPRPAVPATPEPPSAVIRILPSAGFEAYVEEVSGRITVQALDQYNREVAPNTARDAVQDFRKDG